MTILDTEVSPHTTGGQPQGPVMNDFGIVSATVNGSGSQTANNVLIRAIFKMGIPVSGKNLFPSNIEGLPTWYTIRLNKDGYTARREATEILVAFNPRTSDEDLANLPSGGICIHPDDMKFANPRSDVLYYPLPVKDLLKQLDVDTRLREYVANMAYVGALTEILGIELAEIENALKHHFKGKPRPIKINYDMVTAAMEFTRANLPVQSSFRVERMDKTTGQILIDGNTAGALGALCGGASVVAWYPITPSTSLVDAFTDYAPILRADAETNTTTYAIVQAEDELAAAGMVLGAGWAGARAMTATSGPGLSLMNEFVGLGYFAEVPMVIWDVMRMGPSTGLPTRTAQADVLSAYYMGHGDTRHICLFPGSMSECFEFGYQAFNLADRLQTPVIVLSDLDLGMNNWMTNPFDYPETPFDRGKILSAEQITELEQQVGGRFGRYRDYDNDGIAYRTLPGNTHPHAAYLSRGTGHNEFGVYSERAADWQKNLDRLTRKHDTARTLVPKPVVQDVEGAEIGIIAFGSTDSAIQEARDQLLQQGIRTASIRIRALPLEETLRSFMARYARLYVVELNQDGQMMQLAQVHAPEYAAKVRSVRICNGLPLSAEFVVKSILKHEA